MQEIYIAGGAVIIALAVSFWLAPRLDGLYKGAGIKRINYRNREITPSLGPVIPLSFIPALAWISLWNDYPALFSVSRVVPDLNRAILLLATAALGMSLAGTLDDILNEDTRGFRSHLKSLREGRLTSGMIKAIWGTALALLIVLNTDTSGFLLLFNLQLSPLLLTFITKITALLVVLSWTNGINLLDRRPGRALKTFILTGLILVYFGEAGNGHTAEIILFLPLPVIALVLLQRDLGERAMLGDAGSNSLGAVLGVFALLVLPFTGWLVFLALGLALNLAGELVSLTRVIEGSRLLSFFDRLGYHRQNE